MTLNPDKNMNFELGTRDNRLLPSNDEMNFTLYDERLFKPIIISHLPKKHLSALGAVAKFVCLTTVFFPVELKWYLNGLVLEPSEDGRVYFNNNKRELVILSLRKEDQGELVVIAENKFGVDKSRCSLKLYSIKSTTAITTATVNTPTSLTKEDATTQTTASCKKSNFRCHWRQDLLKDSTRYL